MTVFYKADDGTIFDSEEECLKHESKDSSGFWAFAFAIIAIILFV